MRKEKVLSLIGLSCVFGILTISSCSKEEFFGIEDAPCIDYQTMYEIAESDLYIDYQMACYTFANELNGIDSTKRGRVIITDGDTVFENVTIISFEKIKILHDSLLSLYPVLKDIDQADLIEIQEIALSNNKALKEMAPKSVLKSVRRTKDNNYGYTNSAIEWIESLRSSENSNSGSVYNGAGINVPESQQSGSIVINSFELIPCTSVGAAMELAIIWSNNHEGVEVAGYGWSDSGVTMYCEQATESVGPVIPASAGNPQPLLDFHIHPSGWLYPSDSDYQWWSMSPEVTVHLIISPNHEVAVW